MADGKLIFLGPLSPASPCQHQDTRKQKHRFLAHGFPIVAAPQARQAPAIHARGFLLFIRPPLESDSG